MTPSPDNEKPPMTVFWILWSAFLCAIAAYQFTLGHGIPQGHDAPSAGLNPIVLIALIELIVATGIRWFLIPRVSARYRMLVLMIIGIALSESAEFYGIFLIPANMPQTKLVLFVASFVSVLQFAPVFAFSKAVSLFRQH